ncbi:hypothetical protein NL533_30035, partial [Klebsiella pneumoniae]|nr:hypothetical protein [Klebsiella pneumoniae]
NITNAMDGKSYGAEVATTLALSEDAQLRASYTYLEVSIDPPPGSSDPQGAAGSSPQNQVGISSQIDLPWRLETDATFRYVDSLPGQRIRSYVDLDLR